MKKTNATILVIDDQEDILFASKMLLKKHFENIYTLNNPKNIVELLAKNTIDVVLLDMNYRIGFEDGREGLYLLKEIKMLSPKTVVILMTAFGKVETAVEGLKAGAFDYILKPWENQKLLSIVKQGVEKSRRRRSSEQLGLARAGTSPRRLCLPFEASGSPTPARECCRRRRHRLAGCRPLGC